MVKLAKYKIAYSTDERIAFTKTRSHPTKSTQRIWIYPQPSQFLRQPVGALFGSDRPVHRQNLADPRRRVSSAMGCNLTWSVRSQTYNIDDIYPPLTFYCDNSQGGCALHWLVKGG
ncbi:MAG: hypothetical protein V7K38_23455 [Nostoc sp.]|uniref:hypothetical protein n=1 Tax=Nostoc sp. TaxID=1180 RepID=UPI002FF475FC